MPASLTPTGLLKASKWMLGHYTRDRAQVKTTKTDFCKCVEVIRFNQVQINTEKNGKTYMAKTMKTMIIH
jgi:hypothetical protein